MDSGAENLAETAMTFSSNAKKLEAEAKKRRARLIIILTIISLAVLMYIIIPLATD